MHSDGILTLREPHLGHLRIKMVILNPFFAVVSLVVLILESGIVVCFFVVPLSRFVLVCLFVVLPVDKDNCCFGIDGLLCCLRLDIGFSLDRRDSVLG